MRLLKRLAFAAAILGVSIGLTWAQTQPGNVSETARQRAAGLVGSVASSGGNVSLTDYDVCDLINQLGTVFQILRILCVGGAAFVIMGWAWAFINGGKIEMDDVRKKGISLIVSFLLLFGVGTLLTYLPGVSRCPMDW